MATGLQLRQKEPVVLLGQNMPRFIGAPVGDIRVYRYDAAANSFLPVPCQVDERDYKLDYFSAGAQNGLLDSNDEVVFMAQDLGDEAPSDQIWPDDLDSKQHRRYQVAVTDPVTAERGFIYIFVSQTLAISPDSYISYQNNSVFGRSYRAGHNPDVASGLPDTLIIPVAAGGDGLNFISRLRFRIYSDFSGGTILKDKVQLRLTENCSRNYPLNTNLGINGRLYGEVGPNNVIVRAGPVRILRSPSLRVHLWGGIPNVGEFDNTFICSDRLSILSRFF